MTKLNIYVKEVYTANSKIIKMVLNERITISYLISYITPILINHFGYSNYELVEISKNNASRIAEEGDCFVLSNKTIINYYNMKTSDPNPSIAFYIRKMNYEVVNDENVNICCAICREGNSELNNSYNCSHLICRTCFNNCNIHNINRCSLCRSERNNII
jgi:hypothetical protein